jgi:VWFA-related protein
MSRCLIVALGAVVAAVALPGAQEPTFHGGTHTVSVYATVVDRAGRLVPNLTKDDFEILDDGKPQPLSLFRNEIQPITIVIMLDRSGSMVGNFTIVRDAAEQFVTNLLPADRARLGSFSNSVRIDPPDFTSDPSDLIRILRNNLLDAGPTPLWNATFTAMNALTQQEGRRVVLVFTDGYDSPARPTGNVTLAQVIDRSQTEEIMVYAIGLADSCGAPAPVPLPESQPRFQGRGPGGGGRTPGGAGGGRGPGGHGPIVIGGRLPGPMGNPPIGGRPMPLPGPPDIPVGFGGGDGGGGRTPAGAVWNKGNSGCPGAKPDPGLKEVADEGGGGYFELHGTDNLSATFSRVADELHHQYLLAFAATRLDGKLHKLEIRLRDPNMVPRARKNYLAPGATAPPLAAPRAGLP